MLMQPLGQHLFTPCITIMNRHCLICKKKVVGRSDKIFCSIKCKNNYYSRLRKNTENAVARIDRILHRNRSILLEIMGKSSNSKKVSRLVLDKKNFNTNYFTGLHINNRGKTLYRVYDFSWTVFSDQEMLIMRNSNL